MILNWSSLNVIDKKLKYRTAVSDYYPNDKTMTGY